jgi:hypothetical protein
LLPVPVLQEDSSVTSKRAAVRELYEKIKMAIDDVQYKQEKVKRKDHEGDNVRQALVWHNLHASADVKAATVTSALG